MMFTLHIKHSTQRFGIFVLELFEENNISKALKNTNFLNLSDRYLKNKGYTNKKLIEGVLRS